MNLLSEFLFAFTILPDVTPCFFFLTAQLLLLQSPEFGLWLWQMVLVWVGSSGTAWAGVSLLCRGGASSQGMHRLLRQTSLCPLFLASVTLFIWIDSWMAGSQSKFKHFALWDHPVSFSFVIWKGNFTAEAKLWKKFSGHQGLQWELDAYGLSNGDLWALYL